MRGHVLEGEDDFVGTLRGNLAAFMRAANAAGFETKHPAVQAALIHFAASMSLDDTLGDAVDAISRCGDYLRQLSRKDPGAW